MVLFYCSTKRNFAVAGSTTFFLSITVCFQKLSPKHPAGEMFFLVISPSRCLPGCNQLFVRKLCWLISLVMFCCDLVQQVRRCHNLVTQDVSNKCRANLILSSNTIRIIEVVVARDVSHNTNCMISLIDRACLAIRAVSCGWELLIAR